MKKYEILTEREKGIGKGNIDVTDKEKRIGMRFGLRELSRECVGCKQTPLSNLSGRIDRSLLGVRLYKWSIGVPCAIKLSVPLTTRNISL